MEKLILEVKSAVCWACYAGCHVLAHVENGKVVKITGDPDSWQKGFVCDKAAAYIDVHDHPDRLNYPLKRVGERGEGKWERISWDQALDEIAAKLKEIKEKHGPEAVANARGEWRGPNYNYLGRFLHLFGSPNYFGVGHICFTNSHMVSHLTFGEMPVPSLLGPVKCIVLWGINPPRSFPHHWGPIMDRKNEGAQLIVVDPRESSSAKAADMWLKIRPGTDAALGLGWLNVIINEFLYDQELVEKWTFGFDKLAERVKEYPPEKVSKITGVPVDQIQESARLYALTKPAILLHGVKLDQLGYNSTHAIRTVCILKAITGNLDVHGGLLVGSPGWALELAKAQSRIPLDEKLPPQQKKKTIGSDQFRLFSWKAFEMMSAPLKESPWQELAPSIEFCAANQPMVWRAILTGKPYPLRGLIVLANNPMSSATNVKLVYKALSALDLLVVTDLWMTPTAMLADYVLPAADWLEKPHFAAWLHAVSATAEERIVEPLYERRTGFDLWRGLGVRLGQEEYWPFKTLEEAYDYRLKEAGLNMKFKEFVERLHAGATSTGYIVGQEAEFKKYEKYGFGTPSGKVELYSNILEKLGYDPLPKYVEPPESPISSPEMAKEYPLTLMTGARVIYYEHSQFRQVKFLRQRHPDPIVQIHPETAKKFGIRDGDWVYIESPLGKIKQKAQFFSKMDPNIVQAEHAWWFPEKPSMEPNLGGIWESNVNILISDDPDICDPISGSWPHRTLCKIYKAE